MNHKASIYSNPVIPAGLYYCQLLDLHLDISDQPYLWSSLLTGPSYGEYSEMKLASVLYLTPKSAELLAKFKATFRIVGEEDVESYLEAVGRWGCVSVFPKKYQCQEFSCVTFVRQNGLMQKTSRTLEEREQIAAE